jgi:hypothetical protein
MRSTLIIFIVIFSLFVVGCSSNKIDIEPSSYLDSTEIGDFKYSIIRYAGDLAGKASHDNKFDPSFDDYYKNLSAAHELRFYSADTASEHTYFLLTRIAPSLTKKYVAIGGKLKMNKDSITYYEEVFRTWKMPEEEQLKVSEMLFNKMIKGEDLSMYYPENSGDEYIIEFPSEKVFFDTTRRRWLLEELRNKEDLPNMLR